ncbi:MAG: hypothetical protein E7603_08390 [Ruminococcaceae bacterium]|nr:hypothetical protein [Oscillospiraceae bacterium]
MEKLKIEFKITKLPFYAVSHKNGRKTLEIQAFDGILTVSVQYDYERAPLSLNAKIAEGDYTEIILMAHRIELYVNGKLKDEEWPSGNRLFERNDPFMPETDFSVSPYTEPNREEPSVLATFENAEGWYPEEGVFVGDCMPYRRDDEYHVLYLKDRHHHKSKWNLGAHQWEHISTKDFKTWQIHPTAIPITAPWEGSICTGSWIRKDGTEYLYYTVRMGRRIPAPVRRSISTDGFHFEKDENFGFTISEKYHASGARDPKVILGEDGLFHMFLTTALTENGKGCLAHFVSEDMEKWEDVGMPIYISPTSDQPECPDYFIYQGKYYLVFSLCGKAHYMISEKPFEDFREPENSIIPCESVPKGAEWDGKLVFTGFKRMSGYAGTMTFKTATADENGKLIF